MTDKIWISFRKELLNFIRSKISDRTFAEDILQDVFIKIHKNVDALDDESKLKSWVYQITRNAIIDYYRKKNILDYKETLEFDLSDNDILVQKDFSKCLKPFIQNMEESDRLALSETVFGQISQKEYADKIGMSYSGLKSKIQRARKKLKEDFVACCKIETDGYGNVISSNENCDC